MEVTVKNRSLLFFISICLCCFSLTSSYGQEKARRNSIELVFAPLASKTDFKNLDKVITNVGIKDLYRTHLPDRPIFGYYYGLSYKRRIGYRWKVGLGVEYAFNGQQSPRFYSINGVSDDVLDEKPDYGGTQYRVTYRSYGIPLSVEYRIHRKNRWNYWIQAGGFLNIYSRVEARNYTISRATGFRGPGCCYGSYLRSTGSFFSVIQQNLEKDLWRLGFFIGGGVEYEILPFLSLKAIPEFRYYGNLKRAPFAQLASGDIMNVGCRFSLNTHF